MERLYLDTSVFGGYYDVEFELWTKLLSDKIREGKYVILYSQINDLELEPAPERVKNLASLILKDSLEFILNSAEAADLAKLYLSKNVVGHTSRADCNHIALATLNYADIY